MKHHFPGISGRENKLTLTKIPENSKWYGNFPEKFLKKSNIIQFLKCEPIRSKSQNSNGTEVLRSQFSPENLGVRLARLSQENAIPFAPGNVRRLKTYFFVCMESPLVFRLKNKISLGKKSNSFNKTDRKLLHWERRNSATKKYGGGEKQQKWYQFKTKTWWPPMATKRSLNSANYYL